MHAWRKPRWPARAAMLAGLLSVCLPLYAEDANDELLARARAERERKARQACELFERLDLSRAQARKLVPLAEQAAALHIESYELQARLLPEMLEAFGEFAREDSLNQGFTPEVERRTGRLNHRARQAQEGITGKLMALEEQAGQVLEPSQRELLSDSPWPQPPARVRPPRTDARSRARAAARAHEAARRRPLHEARQELRALHRNRHARTGRIAECLLHPYAAERLCRIARVPVPGNMSEAARVLTEGTSEFPSQLVEQQQAQVQQLRTEINNWNLINGLHLSEDQIEQITAAYDQAVAPTWEIVRHDRRSGVPQRALFTLEQEIEQVLNTGQRQVLAEYKACLIPPKNLKDPVRVGQANNNSAYERWLERARKLSRKELAKQIDQTLEREAEHFGEVSRDARRKRVMLLHTTVRRAAAMSETEFELSKAELAEQITPPDRIQEAKTKVAALAREVGEPGVITQFMLTRTFMEQLRLRGKQLAEGVSTKQTDLAKGPQAENCDESCAIDGKGKGKQSAGD